MWSDPQEDTLSCCTEDILWEQGEDPIGYRGEFTGFLDAAVNLQGLAQTSCLRIALSPSCWYGWPQLCSVRFVGSGSWGGLLKGRLCLERKALVRSTNATVQSMYSSLDFFWSCRRVKGRNSCPLSTSLFGSCTGTKDRQRSENHSKDLTSDNVKGDASLIVAVTSCRWINKVALQYSIKSKGIPSLSGAVEARL